ncbi:MAG: CpsD/CapB family tyrosine-protein kinase [Hahellaceae bacterium]|nr:CpsD/CapB family tyrosine-protein kinase [Hahellaceae bacterium]
MDRISKAIELANKKRKDTGSGKRVAGGVDFNNLQVLEVSPSVLEINKVVAGVLTNPVSEYYRVLRTKVLRLMAQNNWKVIGVTGPNSASGKSLTAANLAIAISMEPNYSALLVDADLRKPAQANLFGVNPPKGLGDLVAGKASLGEVVYSPGIEGLGILFNAQQRLGSSDILMSKPVRDMIEQMKSSGENVVTIFDLPPVFVGDDAIAMASHLDAVLVIVNSGMTTKQQLQSALELLKDSKIAGCVLNNAPDSDCLSQQYGYY